MIEKANFSLNEITRAAVETEVSPDVAGKTRVLINGNPVGSHVYGYTPFTLDIRKFLQVGDNEIQVIVRTDVRAGRCDVRDAPFGMTRCSVRGQGDKQKQMAGICPPLLRFYLILKSLRWSLPEVRCG